MADSRLRGDGAGRVVLYGHGCARRQRQQGVRISDDARCSGIVLSACVQIAVAIQLRPIGQRHPALNIDHCIGVERRRFVRLAGNSHISTAPVFADDKRFIDLRRVFRNDRPLSRDITHTTEDAAIYNNRTALSQLDFAVIADRLPAVSSAVTAVAGAIDSADDELRILCDRQCDVVSNKQCRNHALSGACHTLCRPDCCLRVGIWMIVRATVDRRVRRRIGHQKRYAGRDGDVLFQRIVTQEPNRTAAAFLRSRQRVRQRGILNIAVLCGRVIRCKYNRRQQRQEHGEREQHADCPCDSSALLFHGASSNSLWYKNAIKRSAAAKRLIPFLQLPIRQMGAGRPARPHPLFVWLR